MRKLTCGALVSLLSVAVACGSTDFGEEHGGDGPPGQPGTPQDNAQPPPAPVDGKPVPGVYVSSSKGDDSGTGSAARPLKTLKAAFALAKQQGLRVIACAESYEGSVELVDGVSAYGYYDCNADPWKRGAARAKIRSTGATPAVIAKGLTLPTRIEGFEIIGVDLDGEPATETTGTSIALEVRDSRGLVLSESLVHAGKGAPGIDGEAPGINAEQNPAAAAGKIAVGQGSKSCDPQFVLDCENRKWPGPSGGTSSCAVAPNGGPGGAGGAGTWYSDGVARFPDSPQTTKGFPLVGTAATAQGGLDAAAGTNGSMGAGGTDGANGAWSFGPGGFVPGNGSAGTAGSAGQGGGGGGGALHYRIGGNQVPPGPGYASSDTGASGGAGGCGGLAGTPGTGGGASIGALLVNNTDVTFERTRIETSSGGRAGRGHLGSAGTAGGAGGFGASYSGAGGTGGDGGPGGVSGHGAPGPSIALAFSGAKPRLVEADLAPGEGGAGYPEQSETFGATVKVLPAVSGESKAEHAF